MHPDLRSLADRQGGVVTRTQALDVGMTERQLKTVTSPTGAWVTVRRGTYAERWQWDSGDEASRHLMRVHAAALAARSAYVLSHTSAAAVHGLQCRPHWRELVHVSHPRVLGGRTEGGVKHHPAHVPDHQVVEAGGLLVTSLARTAVDIAREHGVEDGVCAADQVLRRGLSRASMEAVITQMWSWPHVTSARAAVALADPGAENIGESLARLFVVELGFGTPSTQVWIEADGRRARVDLLLDGHVFEFDGRQKYVGRERGGFAPIEVEQALWEEKRREDWLRAQDLGVSRIVYADLFGTARRVAQRRVAREYLATQEVRRRRRAS